ncbi:sirt2 [Symbiodinium natans]|uniref:Sirt2 protein n=1 Tax=Symbiodinium natans TaxID=878477 RepID=A0A812PGQ0_9DINO|nr:sirt2 [Symbiodinium natans]
MWRRLLARPARLRSGWFLALGVSYWAYAETALASDRLWLAPPTARTPRVAAAAEADAPEAPASIEGGGETASSPAEVDPEEVLRQLEEAGVFEGQEEVLLQLRELAKQGVHPLDALAGSTVPEEEAQEAVLDSFDVAGVARYLQEHQCRDVVVMCGAGLSTAAGIPDFRTPGTGLYDTLQRFNLSQPEAIFELDFFRQEPGPFYELCRELWPGRYKPTLAHYFIKLLEDKGILRRCYTQNIDSLERQAGVSRSKIVAAHGNFDEAHVIDKVPEQAVDVEELRQAIFAGEEGWRALAAAKGGLVKPRVVLFGESLPDRFWELNDEDLGACATRTC